MITIGDVMEAILDILNVPAIVWGYQISWWQIMVFILGIGWISAILWEIFGYDR